MSTHEREIFGPTPLCLPDGRLDPEAVGFARRPVHDGALPGRWGRRKRWCYWCVTAEPWVLQITLADIDYLSLATLVLLDVESGRSWECAAVHPLGGLTGRAPSMPDGVFGKSAYSDAKMEVTATDGAEGATLRGRYQTEEGQQVRFDLSVEAAADSLNVVVPWSSVRYQLTSKHVGRRTEGSISIGQERLAIQGHAALDYGRGRWPAHTRWNWGTCAGEVEGRRLGVQLGAQWTDGTGNTENGIFLDGRLHKIGGRVRFDRDPERPMAPWHIHGDEGRVDLRFTPICPRPIGIRPLPRLDLAFGRYEGRVRLEQGGGEEELAVPGLFGWAEEVRVLW